MVDATNPGIDGTYCFSGATTYESCDHNTSDLSDDFCDQDGCTPNLFRMGAGTHPALGGDSGAPVYRGYSNSVGIRGMLIAGSNQWIWAHKYNTIASATGFSATVCPSCVP